MADFDNYNDNNTDGVNVNITDPSDPTKKAGVTNGELDTSDICNSVSTPIHTSVGTTAARIDNPTLSNRKEVDIQANKDLWIGFSNAVTSANYYLYIRKGQIVALALGPDVELWAISGSTGGTSDAVVTQGAKS